MLRKYPCLSTTKSRKQLIKEVGFGQKCMEKRYAESHEWLEEMPDGRVKLGLTDYAQDQLGDIVYLNLPEVGDEFEAEDVIGDIESIKSVSDIISPVYGKVVEVNEDLLDAPETINQDAENTWLVILDEVDGLDELMTEDEYEDFIEE